MLLVTGCFETLLSYRGLNENQIMSYVNIVVLVGQIKHNYFGIYLYKNKNKMFFQFYTHDYITLVISNTFLVIFTGIFSN